jgi:hypothetical protein
MQTSHSADPAIGRQGMIADELTHRVGRVISRLAATAVKAGRGVFRVNGFGIPGSFRADPGAVWQNPSPLTVADVDAIVASGLASTTGVQTITTFNGAWGGSAAERMYPERLVTLVLSNHADWDATDAVLTGVDHTGATVSEVLEIPNGGNATVTSVNYYAYITSLVIPEQSGTGGTATVGVAALDATVSLLDFEGVAVADDSLVPNVTPSQDQDHEYKRNDVVSILRSGGRIWVETEDACAYGAAVFVRTVAGAGGSDIGAFRSDGDTSSAVEITGARWGKTSAAAGLNLLELA